MTDITCKCGGVFEEVGGLEGLFCNRCGEFLCGSDCHGPMSIPPKIKNIIDPNDSRLKAIRGVPTNKITLGSESQGRLEIVIPIYFTEDEQKKTIQQQVDLLEYALKLIKDKGLDIMPKRRQEK
jgi:hypothetical protein